jgi:hypothetical protein
MVMAKKNNEQGFIRNAYDLMGALRRRSYAAGSGGLIFDRDYDKEFGYPSSINKDMLLELYKRKPLAQRIVSIYPRECWETDPVIYDYEQPQESPFEQAWALLQEKHNILAYMERVDVLSGIGSYGVMLLGVSDGKELYEPIDGDFDVNSHL